ncbi:MAG TPA: TIGR03086 family metal-binding protein [Acidimicrobiales bacterium]|jgi:uncharacterized protein (TIGR03086 family)|nr:TIGR03086 family metal-binding protein [Acidimicrobiales bacterium]
MSSRVDLHPAAERFGRLVEAVPEDALRWQTPCEAWTVAALLDHAANSIAAFRAAAVKNPLPPAPSVDAANLPLDWRSRVPEDVRALAQAWADPAAWTSMTGAGGIDLPGEVAGIVALDELVIHGWDLAKATGQPADYNGPGLDAILDLVTEFRGGGIEGLFGPEVPVPPVAPLLDRILGVSGRDPDWVPPAATS